MRAVTPRLSAAGPLAVIVIVALVGAVLSPTQAATTRGPSAAAGARAAEVDAPVPQLNWRRCGNIKRTLCATVQVPLDYDDPTGPTTRLALAKKPARDQASKLGTMFVNPGGPGGPARGFVPFAARLLGETVSRRYDVVGIDPRGIGRSTPISCRTPAGSDIPPVDWFFPITRAEARGSWQLGRLLSASCRQRGNAIVEHMSTADTARDMDLIRQAVGEETLHYYGISYGSYLGAVYAALFPERVGRFVVDAVIDPADWANGVRGEPRLPFTTRINSARGAYEALTTGLTECDRLGRNRCVFAGKALIKWRGLVRQAKAGSLTFDDEPLDYSILVGITLSLLYDQDYSVLGLFLRLVHDESRGITPPEELRAAAGGLDSAVLRQRAREVIDAPYRTPFATPYSPSSRGAGLEVGDPFLGVACSDSLNPTGRETWYDAGRAQDVRSRWFGSLWTWASAPCASWPAATKADRYAGDFVTTPANPILVVGNSFDPATPVQGARRFTTLFRGSRFLLLEGWGHGALGNGCVTSAFDDYYATGALPVEGATCEPDRRLFRRIQPQ